MECTEQKTAVSNDEPQSATNQPTAVSESKLKANRENAKKSTGPRTPEGKAYSRRNAIKHGLFASSVENSWPTGENRREYDELLEDLCDQYQPIGRAEELEVERIAVCWCRLMRAWRYENGEFHYSFRRNDEKDRFIRDFFRLDRSDQALIAELKKMEDQRNVDGGWREFKQKFLALRPGGEDVWQWYEEMARKELILLPTDAPLYARELAVTTLRVAIAHTEVTLTQRGNFEWENLIATHLIPNRDALDKLLPYETKFERSLDRAVDRLDRLQRRREGEPISRQSPQKRDSAEPAPSPRKPPQSDRSIIEGQPDSSAADQAVGSTAAPKEVKAGALDAREEPAGRNKQDDLSPTVDLD